MSSNSHLDFKIAYTNLDSWQEEMIGARNRLQKHENYREHHWEELHPTFSRLLKNSNSLLENDYYKVWAQGDPLQGFLKLERAHVKFNLLSNFADIQKSYPEFSKKSNQIPLDILENILQSKEIEFSHDGTEYSSETHNFDVLDAELAFNDGEDTVWIRCSLAAVFKEGEQKEKIKNCLQVMAFLSDKDAQVTYMQEALDEINNLTNDIKVHVDGIQDLYSIIDDEESSLSSFRPH